MTTLGDAATFLSGGTPSRNVEGNWNGPIPWFSAATMKGKILSQSSETITSKGLEQGSRLAPIGATLLLVRGSGLFNHVPICYLDVPAAFNQDVKAIVAKEGFDPLFLHYVLESRRPEINRNIGITGIGAGKIDPDFIKAIEVPDYPLDRQIEIGKRAACFDRQAEINRQINALLAEMRDIALPSILAGLKTPKDLVATLADVPA